MTHLLEVTGLRVAYGGVVAVDEVSLCVEEGQIVGLMGPNGAGKSSVIDALSGYLPSRRGHVRLAGASLDGQPAYSVARRGLVRTFQSVELFDDLTVAENLAVAATHTGVWAAIRDLVRPGTGSDHEAVDWALHVCGLEQVGNAYPTQLSHGQRKLAGVARALARRPVVVLMDEPAAGLDTEESRAFGERLRTLPDQGTSVLLVDHDMGLMLGVCDRIVVLEFGRVIAQGTPEQIAKDPRVAAAYLGGRDAAA